ncbi:XdhC family protein [Streptomyces sp. NPDC004457]|uniref:XdhC family protein n=1 Tax=Streptomyces spinosus TaxID=2872623 RepID=UPI001CEDBE63|nr:XdhC/CoxI family protein [Streptomyces spinosus]
MRDLAPRLLEWQAAGARCALASVVAVRGSAPLRTGAALCVHEDGTALGSVSGGCVEGAVYDLAREVLDSGQARCVSFGYADDDAFAVGLMCGGEIDVLVQAVDHGTARVLAAAHLAAAARRPVVVARVLPGADAGAGSVAVWQDGHLGSTGDPALDIAVLADARRLLDRDGTTVRTYEADASRRYEAGADRSHDAGAPHGSRAPRVLFESWAPPPRLLVFGANAHAAAVSRIGALLGYHVTVCDARAPFTTPERFPDADEVVVDWPHRYLAATRTDHRTVVCVMTHDAKFDVPVLTEALGRPLAYVGALGSRRVQARRREDLAAAGVSPDALARLHAPLGLDLGASTPEETAVSFAAELVAVRSGRTARPLSLLNGPIHPAGAADRPGAAGARCAAGTDPVRGRTTAALRAH